MLGPWAGTRQCALHASPAYPTHLPRPLHPLPAWRGDIRARAQLLITNPDMLHQSLLPVHAQFGRLLGALRYVVVDEAHVYKGGCSDVGCGGGRVGGSRRDCQSQRAKCTHRTWHSSPTPLPHPGRSLG